MIRTLLLSIFLFCAITSFAQVGIGTTTPDPSAQLDVVSTNKGLLVPRVTNTSDVAGTPAKGLVVYQTSGVEGFYVYNGTAWQRMVTADQVFTPAYVYEKSDGSELQGNISFSHRVIEGFTAPDNQTVVPKESGTYLIDYTISLASGAVTSSVVVNGSEIPELKVQTSSGRIMAREIVDLPANATVRLNIFAFSVIKANFSSMTITRLK